MYKVASFFDLSTLAVLCRGSSLSCLDEMHDQFDHCFIVGQFDKALIRLGSFLQGKKIVPIINKSTIQTSKKVCKRFGIRDLQCTFDGWIDRPMSKGRRQLFQKIKSSNPWLTTHAAPPGIRERRGDVDWCTSGIYAVDLAAFLRPKHIIVVGLDFYEADYFAREKVHVSLKKNRKRQDEMLQMFDRIAARDSDTKFDIYTKSTHVRPRDNIRIHVVK